MDERVVVRATVLIAVAAALASPPVVAADDVTVVVRLTDDQEVTGTVAAASVEAWSEGEPLVLSVDGSEVSFGEGAVAAVFVEGSEESWRETKTGSRYLYAPSAIPLGEGEGYVAQKELLFTSAAVGVSDHVALLAGMAIPVNLFGVFAGEGEVLHAIVGVKVATRVSDRLYVGGGTEVAFIVDNTLGLAFANATVGDPDTNVTLGLGAGYGALGDGDGLLY